METNSSENTFTRFITNEQHYKEVLLLASSVKHHLWVGTADIKDLYVQRKDLYVQRKDLYMQQKGARVQNAGFIPGSRDAVPFLGVIASLLQNGVEVRLVHAKEPGPAFREDFDKYPILATQLERALCPRVHFKIMVFDFAVAYMGSANLTGAGMGMKQENRRNFEAGILTNDPLLVEAAMEQFDAVWRGHYCKKCGRKAFCPDKIG